MVIKETHIKGRVYSARQTSAQVQYQLHSDCRHMSSAVGVSHVARCVDQHGTIDKYSICSASLIDMVYRYRSISMTFCQHVPHTGAII